MGPVISELVHHSQYMHPTLPMLLWSLVLLPLLCLVSLQRKACSTEHLNVGPLGFVHAVVQC